MVEEKTSVEEEIYSLCAEIQELCKNYIMYNEVINEEKQMYISRHIAKIYKYINNSELALELSSDKEEIKSMLQVILNSEKNVQNIVENNPQNTYMISEKVDTIIRELKKVENKILSILDISLFMNREGIKHNVALYKRELGKVNSEISKIHDEFISDFGKMKDNQENELEEVSKKQVEVEKSLNEQLDSANKKIVALEDIIKQKNSEIDEIKDSYVEELKGIRKKYEDGINELYQKSNQDFENIENEFKKRDDEISKLIGLIGNKANIGEYKTYADNAGNEKKIWQWITLGSFLLSAVIILLLTLFTKDYDIAVLSRYAISVILLGISGYAGKQASNLRKDEVYYRKQQLELASINVYLADMPDEIKQKIKEDLSNKAFGQARETYKVKSDDSTTANQVLDKLIKIIEDISKVKKQ